VVYVVVWLQFLQPNSNFV